MICEIRVYSMMKNRLPREESPNKSLERTRGFAAPLSLDVMHKNDSSKIRR